MFFVYKLYSFFICDFKLRIKIYMVLLLELLEKGLVVQLYMILSLEIVQKIFILLVSYVNVGYYKRKFWYF